MNYAINLGAPAATPRYLNEGQEVQEKDRIYFVREAHITNFAMSLLMKKKIPSSSRSLWPQATCNSSLSSTHFAMSLLMKKKITSANWSLWPQATSIPSLASINPC